MNPEQPFQPSAPDPSVTPQPVAPEGPQYVGVWYRFLARILDGVFLSIIGSPFLGVIFIIAFRAGLDASRAGSDAVRYTSQQSLIIGACSLAYLLITTLYYIIFNSSKMQGTLGKRILGIKITDTNGSRISFGRATKRYLMSDAIGIPSSLLGNSTNMVAKGISGIFGALSFIYIIVDASIGGSDLKKQTIHDKVAGTFVVRR